MSSKPVWSSSPTDCWEDTARVHKTALDPTKHRSVAAQAGPYILAELKPKFRSGRKSKVPTASSSMKEESVLISCGGAWAGSISW